MNMIKDYTKSFSSVMIRFNWPSFIFILTINGVYLILSIQDIIKKFVHEKKGCGSVKNNGLI